MASFERVRKLLPSRHFYGRWYGNKPRRRWWSLLNWLRAPWWLRFDHSGPEV